MNPVTARRTGILERVLERWQLPRPALPTAEALDDLHAAWLVHVPFENATKLVKAARLMNPEAAVRGPVEFWEDHLRWGSGGTCFASSYAFQFLLRYLGYRSRLLFCHLPAEKPQAHTALLVEAGGGTHLVDVGYALPAPVPLPAGDAVSRRSTIYYDVELRPGPGGEILVFSEDARGQRFRYRFAPHAAADGAYLGAWARTFALTAPYMRRLALGRFQENARFLYKEPGRVFAINREGEREVPMTGPPAAALSGLFRIPQPLLQAAIGSLGRLQEMRAGSFR